MPTILIIDDEEGLRGLLSRLLRLEGFQVEEARDVASGLRQLERSEFDVVFCDVKLPDGNGVELIPKIKTLQPFAEVILLTAFGNIPDGVQAIKSGAFDYLTKGDDDNRILPLLHRALEKVALQKRLHHLERQLDARHAFDQIIGESPALKQAVALAKKVAPTDTTVLLLGETGTGKEVFAKAIHQGSTRRDHHFVAVNCSALSRELLESELFGYKAGAFTGAMKDRKGLMEEAEGGTLLLDEMGEMAPELQSKLLRVLETGEFHRVGDAKTLRANVRIIAATNRDLFAESQSGRFRSDLFYRLSVFTINLPSLAERRDDIPALADYFVSHFSQKMNRRNAPLLSVDFLEKLKNYPWKGNIRELRNVIERALILCDGDQLDARHLPSDFFNGSVLAPTQTGGQLTAFSLAAAERLQIQKVLMHTGGNKTEAAKLLGIGLTTLYRKIEEYGI